MKENKHTLSDLYQMQALSLESKIRMTEQRIYDWIDTYGRDGVAVSFSGGKDSTVLMDIVRNQMGYTDIPAVFVDVPTQLPELKEFALTWDNVEVIYPKKSFIQVCKEYGFPLISKEVSESVYGARKYLTSILEQNSLERTNERTNERSRDTGIGTLELLEQEHIKGKHPYHYETSKILGTYRRISTCQNVRGGYDRKYRRIRGIGEFAQPSHDEQGRRQQSETCDHVRNADEGQGSSDQGEYP